MTVTFDQPTVQEGNDLGAGAESSIVADRHAAGSGSITPTGQNIITVLANHPITMNSSVTYTPTGGPVEVDVSLGRITSIPDGTTVTVTNHGNADQSQYPARYKIENSKLVKMAFTTTFDANFFIALNTKY